MAIWRYTPCNKVTTREYASITTQAPCPECKAGQILRLAVRESFFPYSWVVTGYACTVCYSIWTEGPSRV